MAAGTSWAEDALAGVRAAGLRRGEARQAVIGHLGAQPCCMSVREIFEGVCAAGRRIGIASVYRALAELSDLGLVQRIDVGDGVARFEPAHTGPGRHHHHHLVCDDCGTVEPFFDRALEDALDRAADSLGRELQGHEVLLRGACGDCRERG